MMMACAHKALPGCAPAAFLFECMAWSMKLHPEDIR